ncbi:hypothetical protein KCP70_09390 [Salmonella enterica subsp. enterica]|nr:hypothetical protein KCP70_09390 [Salmonella enterica subsp. enterica]
MTIRPRFNTNSPRIAYCQPYPAYRTTRRPDKRCNSYYANLARHSATARRRPDSATVAYGKRRQELWPMFSLRGTTSRRSQRAGHRRRG